MEHKCLLVLVGGFGFIGRNVIESIATRPEFSSLHPLVIDDLSNACPGYDALGVDHYLGHYQAPETARFLEEYSKDWDCRVFVFLAGETRVAESRERPLDFIDANISQPSRFVTDVIRPDDRFILISTAGALFDGSFEVRVDSPYCPKNFYGATKAAEEMVLRKLVELRGGAYSVVRLTNVFGRFSDLKKSAIHAFTKAIIAGETVTINGDGKQSRDFVFASDVGFGLATLAHRFSGGLPVEDVYMLGSGRSVTLWNVVEAIELAAGTKLSYERKEAVELLKTEPRDVIASEADVRVLLGDRITPFEEGIRQTYQYYAG